MSELVLVTGAGGFIGSHLTELLVREGYRVRALTHYNFQNDWGWLDTISPDVMENVEVVPSDVCDPFAVHKAVKGVSKVFHLASLIAIPYSYQAPASYVDTNIRGTLNVLQACLSNEVELLVHTSTSETYGSAQYVPIDENHPLVAQSPYAATKIAADKLVESYHLSFSMPVAIVRPFNTFGPRQSARAIVPTIIIQALAGNSTISLGALDPVRDLNYVKDTAYGFLSAARSVQAIGKTINLGRGEGISIGKLASMILEICESPARLESLEERLRPEASEVMRLVCDNSNAKKLLDWTPRYDLSGALEETVSWFSGNLDRYKTTIYNI